MTEVSMRPTSAFPRPASLYLPQVDSTTPAILRSASYSPFPVIAGASHDPHGLDQFLLPPDDPSWLYTHPPAADAMMPLNDSPLNDSPKPVLKKVRSFSMLRPSPLSQSSSIVDPEPSPRKRSNSVDSIPSPTIPTSEIKTEPKRKFMFRRKSVVMDELEMSADPTTPMSSRSISEISSASSSSSSEGVKTPSETAVEVEIAGSKLAVALAAAGDKGKKGSWRGWLGGKRKNNTGTPVASPNASVVDLAVPQVTLTPSPDIATPDRGPIIDQMRRLSFNKLGQLRAPSPHPLALSLKRQYSNLPDEVAVSITSGQRVFPMSVNAYEPMPGLTPRGGLATSLGVRAILLKLDKGDSPDCVPRSRRRSDPMILRRPRGVLDFVNRAPFEERNIVFFPNGSYSPISMARPGYGVWDLDFSAYIQGLSAVDVLPGAPWPNLPRASMGPDALPSVMPALPSPESEVEEVLVSPAAVVVELEEETVASPTKSISPVKSAPSPTKSAPSPTKPVSSFKTISAERIVATWEESEDEDEDEEPLAMLVKKAVKSTPRERTQSMPSKRVSIIDDDARKQRNMAEVARARERRSANLSGETERRAEAEKYRSTYTRASSAIDLTTKRNSASSSTLQPSSPPGRHRRRTQSSYEEAPRPPTTRTPPAPARPMSKRYQSFYEAQPSVPAVALVHPAQYYPQPFPNYPMGYAQMPAYVQPMVHPAYISHSSSRLSLAVPNTAHLNPRTALARSTPPNTRRHHA